MQLDRLLHALERRNVLISLRLMKKLKQELKNNRLLDLKELYIVSRIQAQVMATLATHARTDKLKAELLRLRELAQSDPDEFKEAFLDEEFRELLKTSFTVSVTAHYIKQIAASHFLECSRDRDQENPPDSLVPGDVSILARYFSYVFLLMCHNTGASIRVPVVVPSRIEANK